MKRIGGLWDHLTSFSNLLAAFRQARRGKRHLPNVAAFEFNLEPELFRLQRELLDRSYTPGDFAMFQILEPKPRLISAAPFRDRVVHHALCRVLEPIYERRFIHDSYACRKGKGTHAAVDRFQHFARQHRHVLKCDVSKYFPSIDHGILKDLIARKIKDREVLRLVGIFIDHSNEQESLPPDELWPVDRRRGLPLGNQTSQFFANIYLDPFDHAVKQTLGARCYLRYVDDFAIFDDDASRLMEVGEECRTGLAALRLRLHPRKAVISRVEDGTRFLGYRVFPTHRLLPRDNVTRMLRRLRKFRETLDEVETRRRIAGWMGHASRANVRGLCEWMFASPRSPEASR